MLIMLRNYKFSKVLNLENTIVLFLTFYRNLRKFANVLQRIIFRKRFLMEPLDKKTSNNIHVDLNENYKEHLIFLNIYVSSLFPNKLSFWSVYSINNLMKTTTAKRYMHKLINTTSANKLFTYTYAACV